MLINSEGEQKELSCFERGARTEAYYSCSINWKNQFHVFGGFYQKRQISRLSGYRLELIGNLAFAHSFGTCSVMANQLIFLCFNNDWNDFKRCRRSIGPLETFTEITLSKHNHRGIQTSCSDSKSSLQISHNCLGVLVAVGSAWPNNKKGEKFEDGDWIDIQEAPVGRSLNYYAVVFYGANFYYFGGTDRKNLLSIMLSSILRLNAATWTWSNVGNLNSVRYGHKVILVENTFMVIGGPASYSNEACLLNNGRFTCEERTSSLNSYYMPLLFLVSDNFGRC